MDKFYQINIAGLERELPICKLNDELSIAGFIMFGDVELTEACAKELLNRVGEDFDYIVTPEAKSIPLAYEMSRISGKKYIVVRKKAKVYMQNPVSIKIQSITTKSEQNLYLDSAEGELIRGKRIIIVDDVISTGESLAAVEQLVKQFDVVTVAKTTVLAEGDAADRPDIVCLGELPLFKN